MTYKRKEIECNGYGVTLVICSMLLTFMSVGTSISFGIIIRHLLQDLHGGKGETSWIASVNTGLMFGFSPVSGILERQYGCRLVTVLGAVLGATGLVLSFFVPSLHYLYFTYGVISGCGFSMVLLATTVPILLHFDKRRNLAMSFGSLGTGFGMILWPLIMTFFLEKYDWRGSFLLLGGLFLQTMISGMLIGTRYRKRFKEPRLLDEKNTSGSNSLCEDAKCILGNPNFITYLVAGTVTLSAMISPYIFLPDLGYTRGLNTEQQAMLLTASGIAVTCERPLVGGCLDKARHFLIMTMGVVALIQGLATIFVTYMNSYPTLLFYAVTLGSTNGIYQLLQSTSLLLIVKRQHFSLALGIFRCFLGVGITVGPPIIGWITDYRGKYDWACFYLGVVLLLGGTTLVVLNVILRKHSSDEKSDFGDFHKFTENKQTIVINTD